MAASIRKPLLVPSRIDALVQVEPAIIIIVVALLAWLAYKLLLSKISEERHRNLNKQFRTIVFTAGVSVMLLAWYSIIDRWRALIPYSHRILPYLGVACAFSIANMLIRTFRVITFIYLFRLHMRVGVPLLIVNLLTLLLSIVVGLWLMGSVFGLDLGPIVATSAVFSIVLGLAVQDTLGNLIAGVAMQFDSPKTYEIGDWIEIVVNGQRIAGEVQEISWRSTVLIGVGDELITVPNRICAQAQVSNFSAKGGPFIRTHVLRIPYKYDHETVQDVLLHALLKVPDICARPKPLVLISEAHESWVAYKLVYFIRDYGGQNIILDQVLAAAFKALKEARIEVAVPKLELLHGPSEPKPIT